MKKILLASVLAFGLPAVAYGQSDDAPSLMKMIEDKTHVCKNIQGNMKEILEQQKECEQREDNFKKLEKLGWCLGLQYNSNRGAFWMRCNKKERSDITIPYGQSELYFNGGLVSHY